MAPRRINGRAHGTVTTTDAVPTVLATYPLPATAVCQCEANVQGRDGSGNAVVAKQLATTTSTSGTGGLVGAILPLITTVVSVALTGASVTLDVSGNTVRVLVTGKLATTIEWSCDLHVWEN